MRVPRIDRGDYEAIPRMATKATVLFGLTTFLALSVASRVHAETTAPSGETVQPPVLEHFVEAAYPEGAEHNGQDPRVSLILDIDATGHVTRVEVSQSAGAAFDEAARDAALGLLFTPATRNWQPVAVRISFEYVFRADQPEAVGDQTGVPAAQAKGASRDLTPPSTTGATATTEALSEPSTEVPEA